MNCASCSAEIEDTVRFCPECGAAAGPRDRETRKTVTILFCDISGSTAMSEQIDAESLRTILMRYFTLMRSCLIRHGGTVEKYIGDAVMAVFGVPVVHEDDALRAVRAAAEMCAAAARLNEELVQESGVEIAIRIGVNTGEVVAVDAPTGGQAFVSGEAVNMAARLEQHAAVGAVLMGDLTYRLASGAVAADAVPPLTVRGRSEPLPAWRLREVQPGTAPIRRRFDVPLLGREHEMSQLRLLLDGARRSLSCHICTIFGDPGVGKSRIAHEFGSSARSAETLVVFGGCSAYDGGTLSPFDSILAGLLEAAGIGCLPEAFVNAPAVATTLAGILRDGAPGTAEEDSFRAVREAVTAAARGRAVVIVLDDVQWASPVLLDLIAHLADRLHGAPVLILCLARFELLDTRPQWGGGRLNTTSVVLGPLAAEHTRQVAANLAEVSSHLSGGVVERVADAAEGNPFFVEQMMAMCHEHQAGEIPATLRAVVAARLDLLPAPRLGWLQWAALSGERFTVSVVAEMSGQARLDDEDLHVLVQRRLIEPCETRQGEIVHRFTSSQIREVAYTTVPKRLRAERHVRAARVLAVNRPEADDEIGTHLESAARCLAELGMPAAVLGEEAGHHLDRAGRTALSLGDVHRATALFERVLAVAPGRLPTMAVLADMLLVSGEYAAADRLLDELGAEAERRDEPRLAVHGRLQQAVLHLADRGLDHLVDTADAALPVFQAAGDDLGIARCWLRLGQASQAYSRFDEAGDRFEKALGHATDAAAQVELATVLGGLAYCLWRGPVPTSRALRRCEEIATRYDDFPSMTRVAVDCPRALLLGMRRRFDDARAILDEARRILDDLGHVTAGATVPIFAGNLELLAGRPEAAERAFLSSRAAFAELGDGAMRDAATIDLARAVLQQGRNDEAAGLLASCRNLDSPLLRTEAALAMSLNARILAEAGEPALPTLDRALALTDELESPQCRGTVLLDAAHVLFLSSGALDGAAAALRAHACFAEKEDLVGLGLADSFLGEAGRG